MTDQRHTFHACPDCGATVRDDYVELHQGWHDDHDAAADLELDETWPEAEAAATPPSSL